MISLAEWHAGGDRLAVGAHSIFVRQDGPTDGAPATLLHGFPTSSHDWAEVLPYLLDAGLRVTMLDFLGFGASDKPRPHDYTLMEQASIVEAAWVALGIGPTALVAHDYGVSVGEELLARDPERITSMTWLNGGIYPDLHRPTAGQQALAGPDGPAIAAIMTEELFSGAIREILGRAVADQVMHELWLAVQLNDGATVAPALLGYMAERRANAQRWVSALEGYDGPTTFIWGPVDPVSGSHVAERVAQRLPNATLHVLDEEPAVGHYPQVEAPELVGPLLVTALTPK